MTTSLVRVLVIDDAALVRKVLREGLSAREGIEVVGTAVDPFQARDLIVKLKPDVLTLDVEMPRMDGLEFLKRLMPQYPLPVIMVSALTEAGAAITLQALEAGALDFVCKPSQHLSVDLKDLLDELSQKILEASRVDVSHYKGKIGKRSFRKIDTALSKTTDKIIAIGASTGGVEAIRNVISRFPATCPGTVIVQHMPPGFTRKFAERMNRDCAPEVKEAQTGDRVKRGSILIAPGDKHLTVKRSGGIYEAVCLETEKVCGHMPSVEVLFQSVAEQVGRNALGVILTGMGGDGAEGLLAMKEKGAVTLAQNEKSCVVYGMPKVAVEKGGVEKIVPLDDMAEQIFKSLQ
jgi:two-component system chemotaxis response regulator CheB